MSTLRDRMSWDMPVYPDKHQVENYAHITEVPLMRIATYDGLITYEDLDPLISADGAPIAATGRGSWGQLYRAGRM